MSRHAVADTGRQGACWIQACRMPLRCAFSRTQGNDEVKRAARKAPAEHGSDCHARQEVL